MPIRRLTRLGHTTKAPKLFYQRICLLDNEIPNDDLIRAMEEAERDYNDGKLKSYSTVQGVMTALDAYTKKK